MAHKNSKLVLFMLIGSVAMSFAAMIAGNARFGASISPTTFFTSIIVSVLLFMVAGMFWVMVAAAIRRRD